MVRLLALLAFFPTGSTWTSAQTPNFLLVWVVIGLGRGLSYLWASWGGREIFLTVFLSMGFGDFFVEDRHYLHLAGYFHSLLDELDIVTILTSYVSTHFLLKLRIMKDWIVWCVCMKKSSVIYLSWKGTFSIFGLWLETLSWNRCGTCLYSELFTR